MANPFSLTLVTAPAAEPITTAQAKTHLRVDVSADDTFIDLLVAEAREWMENHLRRALITQTWDLFMDEFPSNDEIEVPMAPLSSVTSVKYIDNNGDQQTWDSANYRVDTDHEPGRITPAYGVVWPTIRPITKAVEIRFVAGYGTAGTDLPQPVMRALYMMVGQMYEQRQTGLEFAAIERLVASNRMVTF